MSDSPPPPPPPPPPASPKTSSDGNSTAHPPVTSPSGPPRLGRSNSIPAPSSKLLAHLPLDAPDDLDRNWAWHYMMSQKHVPGEMNLERWIAVEGFEKHTAMLYGLLTDDKEGYFELLLKLWEHNEALKDKSFQGIQALIDIRFVRLTSQSRANLLWLLEQCVQKNFAVDTLLIVLMRHVNATIQVDPCLVKWLLNLFTSNQVWDSIAPHVTYTLLSVIPELRVTKPNEANLAVQCVASIYAGKPTQALQCGREILRLLYECRETQELEALIEGANDASNGLTPPKFLACRLTFKMQDQLRFLMEKVLHVSAHRYQKWFQANFLQAQPCEGLIADIVRYVCAVFIPTNQALEAKMTPRYHILGWVLLLNKSATAKARVLHAMYFDFLNYQSDVNIMHLEPAMMLLLKSTKNKNHALVQDIVQFLLTHMNTPEKENRVNAAINGLIKLGMMKNLLPLHDYLKESNPGLLAKCQQSLPQHFKIAPATPGAVPPNSSVRSSPGHTSSPSYSSPRLNRAHSSPHSSPQSSPQHQSSSPKQTFSPTGSPKGSPKDAHVPSSSPTEDQTNWTEQSFLDERKLPLDSNSLAPLVIPESLQIFQEHVATLQQSQGDVDKLIPALGAVFTTWSHLPNAIPLSGDLGSLLYKCLEKSFLTTTTLPHYVLDQCLQRPPQLYLPLLHGMYKQDSVLSARLLTYCSVQENLQPYVSFCELIGAGDIPLAILQDVGLCAHLDEACALACSLLQVPYAGNAIESTCLQVIPYLFQHAPPAYMPRTDALLRALVSVATPCMLNTLAMRILLREFTMFRDQTATVLLSSLQWNSWEQWGVWELLAAEWEAKKKEKSTIAALRKVLACLDPNLHGEALGGILRLLLQCTPDVSLLHCILKLSEAYHPFPSSILSIWIEKCFAAVQSVVVVMVRENQGKDVSDVCRQLNKLPDNLLVQDPDIRVALLQVINDQPGAADLYPSLITQLTQDGNPSVMKKQRTE